MIKFSRPEEHPKGWGRELWVVNFEKYCGKILELNKGAKFSMHYHVKKEETFYVLSGTVKLYFYNLTNADECCATLSAGMSAHIEPSTPHQIEALTDAKIIEFSTQHFEEDSYRIKKGDSQCKK